MTNQENSYPCKCGHSVEAHGVVDEDRGGYERLDDGEDGYYWHSYIMQIFMCSDCNMECNFERMTNLEYLEWKYDLQNKHL